jgi:hypothetical protein
MHYRFTATKEDIELGLIKFLQENKTLSVKKDNDYKGISFNLIWERISDNEFKLICYHKGLFSIISEEFKELVQNEPFAVVNTLLYKELFSLSYIHNPVENPKDIVYTSLLNFKYIDLFESKEVMLSYLVELFSKTGWKLQESNSDSFWVDYSNL